jgi:hypothetical protein
VEERVEEGQTAKEKGKFLGGDGWLGPGARSHSCVDSKPPPVPHPAGLVHLRVVGFLVVFPERGARMASACTVTALENRGCSLLERSSFSATLNHP